jgi:hypothetical protein
MTRIPTTPEAYAAFRAECLKADIEMDSVVQKREYCYHSDDDSKRLIHNAKSREWAERHRQEIRDKQNAKKKAARLLEQSKAAQ